MTAQTGNALIAIATHRLMNTIHLLLRVAGETIEDPVVFRIRVAAQADLHAVVRNLKGAMLIETGDPALLIVAL